MEDALSYIAEYGINFLFLPFIIIAVFFVHECGHFLAAYLCGMKVEYISIGAGRVIWSRTDSRGMVWKIHLWPVAAHVHISDYKLSSRGNYFQKMFVVLSGPLANLILPFVVLFIFYASFGKPAVPPIVTGVQVDMPAYNAGLQSGDRIITINNTPIQTIEELKDFTRPYTERPLAFEYERQGLLESVAILPQWYEYKDDQGIERAHGRIGVIFAQKPYDLEVVEAIDGIVPDDEDHVRALLKARLGQRFLISLKSNDRLVHDYMVALPDDQNRHFYEFDKSKEDQFYLGTAGDNFYLKMSIGDSYRVALAEGREMIVNILKLPFNLFPIDKEWLQPDASVSTDTSLILHYLYFLMFKIALFSVLVAFINLVPIPGLDGSVVLMATVEAAIQKELTNKHKAILIGSVLATLYAAIFIANAPDLHGYFDFKIESFKDE